MPIIIRKLERLGDPYSVNIIELLKDYLAPASSEEWQKKVRQVKLYRSLERMNTTALMDLAGNDLFASDVLEGAARAPTEPFFLRVSGRTRHRHGMFDCFFTLINSGILRTPAQLCVPL